MEPDDPIADAARFHFLEVFLFAAHETGDGDFDVTFDGITGEGEQLTIRRGTLSEAVDEAMRVVEEYHRNEAP